MALAIQWPPELLCQQLDLWRGIFNILGQLHSEMLETAAARTARTSQHKEKMFQLTSFKSNRKVIASTLRQVHAVFLLLVLRSCKAFLVQQVLD